MWSASPSGTNPMETSPAARPECVNAGVQGLVVDAFLGSPFAHGLALAVRRRQHLAKQLIEVRLLAVCRKMRIAASAGLGISEASHDSCLGRVGAHHPWALAADVHSRRLLEPHWVRSALALHGENAPVIPCATEVVNGLRFVPAVDAAGCHGQQRAVLVVPLPLKICIQFGSHSRAGWIARMTRYSMLQDSSPRAQPTNSSSRRSAWTSIPHIRMAASAGTGAR